MEFPKKLYVGIEEVGTNEEWFKAVENHEDLAEFGESRKIAIYELVTETEIETKIKIKDDQNIL